MKFTKLLLKFCVMFSVFSSDSQAKGSAYEYQFKTLIDGTPMLLSDFKDRVILIVNTASKCGFTTQYAGLQKLYETYKDQGLVIIGVPSNDFGDQEPGTNQEISKFCELNYGVNFPMTSKSVVSGDGAHPFYVWAKNTLGFGTAPKWNFHKYLINRKGDLIDYFNSTVSPQSKNLESEIVKALSEKP